MQLPLLIVRFFRYGKVTLGPTWIRLQNRTNDTTIWLNPEQWTKWYTYLTRLEPSRPRASASHSESMSHRCSPAPRS